MTILLYACVVASIAFTVTESRLFAPLRKKAHALHPKAGDLVSCSYCLGHWIACGLVVVYQPRLFVSSFPVLDYVLTTLVIAWIAGIQAIGMTWMMHICGK